MLVRFARPWTSPGPPRSPCPPTAAAATGPLADDPQGRRRILDRSPLIRPARRFICATSIGGENHGTDTRLSTRAGRAVCLHRNGAGAHQRRRIRLASAALVRDAPSQRCPTATIPRPATITTGRRCSLRRIEMTRALVFHADPRRPWLAARTVRSLIAAGLSDVTVGDDSCWKWPVLLIRAGLVLRDSRRVSASAG